MKRPIVSTRCPADTHHGSGERIVEVMFPDGSGGLLSFRTLENGTPVVEAYRFDPKVEFRVPGPKSAG